MRRVLNHIALSLTGASPSPEGFVVEFANYSND